MASGSFEHIRHLACRQGLTVLFLERVAIISVWPLGIFPIKVFPVERLYLLFGSQIVLLS